jgi:AraC-like DNA-binding protein
MSHPLLPAVPQLPGAYVNLLTELVSQKGVSTRLLLSGSGVSIEKLERPYWYVDFACFDALLQRAIHLTGEPDLPVKLGLQMTVTCHGPLGFAMLVSPDLRAAIQLGCDLLQHQCRGLRLTLHEGQDKSTLRFEQPLASHQVGDAALMFLMVGLGKVATSLVGRPCPARAEMTVVKPNYSHGFLRQLFRFGAPSNQWVFSTACLGWPLPNADPIAARLVEAQCKRFIIARNLPVESLSQTIRQLVMHTAEGQPTIEQVATKLKVSARTLQRKLASEGSNFSDIGEQVRCEKAAQLLRTRRQTVSSIAEELGYASVANFGRAFRRWYSCSPSAYISLTMTAAAHGPDVAPGLP